LPSDCVGGWTKTEGTCKGHPIYKEVALAH